MGMIGSESTDFCSTLTWSDTVLSAYWITFHLHISAFNGTQKWKQRVRQKLANLRKTKLSVNHHMVISWTCRQGWLPPKPEKTRSWWAMSGKSFYPNWRRLPVVVVWGSLLFIIPALIIHWWSQSSLRRLKEAPKKMQLSVGLKQVGNLSWDNTSVVAVQVGGIKFEESGPEIASTMNDHNSHHPGETVLWGWAVFNVVDFWQKHFYDIS